MGTVGPAVFNTDGLRPSDQLAAWREWFNPVFDIQALGDGKEGFAAENLVWSLGGVLMTRALAPAARVSRSRTNIRKSAIDHWVISYCRNGSTVVEIGDDRISAPPRVPYIWSLGQPFASERSRVERIQLILPRDEFQGLAAIFDKASGTSLTNPLGRLLGDYMLALDRWVPEMNAEDVSRLSAGVRGMISACIMPSPDRLAVAEQGINSARKERVRRIVAQNLRSPQLTPETICKLAGLSRSLLYRLFENNGGIVHYVQRQRLQEAYTMLSDAMNTKRIHEIALELCFQDASSFSRAFHLEFECTPSAVRIAAIGGAPQIVKEHANTEMRARFGDLLA
jgi:AraC-like DNA-binding protein